MLDARREAAHIWKEFGRYHKKVGENVVWFRFDVEASKYAGTYDEGGRRYHKGLNVAVLWIDQIESSEQYSPEGRRPVQALRFASSARVLAECGISDKEAHGHRYWDPKLAKPWFDDRSNDVIYYDGRFYEISNFQIRGRIQEDVIIGITCTEVFPEDEFAFDLPPGATLR